MANVVHNLKVNGSTYPVGTVHYIAGTGTTAGTWLGTDNSITEYFDGLTIAYKIPIAGSSTTTLNINGLGAKTVRRNTSNLTTHLPANTVVVLTYTTISGTGYWVWADYDSNSDTKVTQTVTTSNASYPLLLAPSGQTATTTTTSYFDSGVTLNPSTNTIAANISGNAGTATKLATARSIALGTGATGTATNFDGSANITIPVTAVKEAYLSWGGKNFAGSCGPLDSAMIPQLGANRLAFVPAAGITLEYSTDGGSTWSTRSDSSLAAGLFGNGVTNGSFYIGNNSSSGIDKSNYQCRVTVRTDSGYGNVYTVLNKFAINVSTSGSSGCWCTIQARLESNRSSGTDTWVTYADKVTLRGWSGWNIINTNGFITYGNSASSQYGEFRFIFGVDSHASTVSYPGLSISKIMGFGGEGWIAPSNAARNGSIYTWDVSQNVTFPAALNTTGELKEKGTRVSKVGHTHSVTAVGTVSQPTFTGTAASHNHTFTGTEAGHTHTFSGTAASHDHSFTGTKHKHTFTGSTVTSSGASATTSIYQITGVGTAASHSYTAPSLTATVSDQCLTLTWSAGSHSFTANTVPTRSAVTVAVAHTHSVTAAGTLDEVAATGTVGSKSITPAGTVNETKITPAGTIANTSVTPSGTVSKPTFTGSAVTSGKSSN